MEEINGIIISVTKYREKDAIINILTKDKVFTVQGRSSFSVTSKTFPLIKLFTKGTFELYKGNTANFKLKDGNVEEYYFNYFEDNYFGLVTSNFIEEITVKMLIDNEINKYNYILLEKFLDYYSKYSKNRYFLVLLYFAKLLKINGISINFDECEVCHKKLNLNKIDFSNGGVICDECDNNITNMSIKSFSLYKSLFLQKIDDVLCEEITLEQFKEIFDNLCILFESSFGFKLNSQVLIDKIK